MQIKEFSKLMQQRLNEHEPGKKDTWSFKDKVNNMYMIVKLGEEYAELLLALKSDDKPKIRDEALDLAVLCYFHYVRNRGI